MLCPERKDMDTTEKLWVEYRKRLLFFIRKRVNDDAAADDILQDIFVKIHTRIDTLKEANRLESWLYQIARNAVIDHYRTQKPSEELPKWIAQQDIDKSEQVKQELVSCLRPMIEHLPYQYRDAVVLSELEGMKQKKVAQKQGISLSGAKSRVQRGRELLKGMLHECCKFELSKNNQLIDFTKKSGGNDYC